MSHDDQQATDDAEQPWWHRIDRDRVSRRQLLYLVAVTVVGTLAALFGIDRQPPPDGYGNLPYGRRGFGK